MKPKVTPKDFFLWAGAMLALYVSVFSFLGLFFDYIDNAFPDSLTTYYDPYSASIRFAIASLVVLFPTFLLLMRLLRNDMLAHPEKKELWVRRWALYFTLFAAAATVAVDLITLINYYLDGDVTMRFFLKVLVVFLVTGAGFLHFFADLRDYWEQHPAYGKRVAWGAGILVVLTVLAGFFIIGAPWNVRLYRLDDQKVSDLQSIQWQIVNYWQAKGALPGTITDLNDPISNFSVPKDSQTGAQYEYQALKKDSFELCAAFNAESQNTSPYAVAAVSVPASSGEGYAGKPINDSWMHAAGRYCFLRTIDPARYPVLKK